MAGAGQRSDVLAHRLSAPQLAYQTRRQPSAIASGDFAGDGRRR